LARASVGLFLTAENDNQRSICVKPTLLFGVNNFGKSCIMHSRRVGFLNVVFSSSAYFGFTNSGIFPPDCCKISLYVGQ